MSAFFGVRAAGFADLPVWGSLRRELWPDETDVGDEEEMRDALDRGDAATVLLAVDGDDHVLGFAEASLRREYVNGTDTSPVGFLEGWYVRPEWRGRGVGRALVDGVEAWTRAQRCSELASDTWLDNPASQAAHRACGFEETERIVCFRKSLA